MWPNYLSDNFKIIVINNGGGNIFTLIETGPEIEPVRNYFETQHSVNLKQLTAAYGLEYFFCDDQVSLEENLKKMFLIPNPSVLEVKTYAATDTRVFKQYFTQLKK